MAAKMSRLEDTSGAVGQLIFQDYAKAGADTATYLLSVFIKKSASLTYYQNLSILFSGTTPFSVGVNIDALNGNLGDAGLPAGFGIVNFDANTWRVWIAQSDTASNTTVRARLYPAYRTTADGIDGGAINVAATGLVDAWGLQLELASSPSAYDPSPAYMVPVSRFAPHHFRRAVYRRKAA